MKFFLIRHGESTWNRLNKVQGQKNPGLSKKGRLQVYLLRRRFKKKTFDVIYSSPLKRAYETAEILAKPHNLPILIHEGLSEIKLGIWEGRTLGSISRESPELLKQWYKEPLAVRIKGAETVCEFRDRVQRAFFYIESKHKGGNIAVVTHGGVISVYIGSLLGMDLNKVWSTAVKNTALSILSLNDSFPQLLLFNDTCHLESFPSLETW